MMLPTGLWRAIRFFLLMLSVAGLSELAHAQTKNAKIPEITSVDQLMPSARYFVKTPSGQSHMYSTLGAKKGDKILLVAEVSIDSLVVEALRNAALETGAEFNVILLNAFALEEDPVKLEFWLDPHDLLPDWIWKAMENSTIVATGFPMGAHTMTSEVRNWFRERKIKQVGFQYYTRELMAMARINYPDELFDAINVKVWKAIYGAKRIRITDSNGTDLIVELDDGYWERARKDHEAAMGAGVPIPLDEPINWGHIQVSPMLSENWEKTRGTVVAFAMHGGLIPKTKLVVERGRVVRVEGSGSLFEYVNHQLTDLNSLRFPVSLGPGVTYLAEITLGTDPKAQRGQWETLKGQSRYWSFAEDRKRSGVIHIAWGTPTTTICTLTQGCPQQDQLDYAKAHRTTIQHLDVELYHVTYYADGKKIVDNGHLLALNDPEIRKIASKHGNPDELLRENWVPDEEGR